MEETWESTYAVLESCAIQMIYNGIRLSLERGPV